MTFVPLLGYYLLRRPRRLDPPIEERRRHGFTGVYYRVGVKVLKHRWISLVVSCVFLVAGGAMFTRLSTSFFPDDVQYLSYIDLWLPDNVSFARTDAVAERAAQIVREVAAEYAASNPGKVGKPRPVLKSVTTFVGGGAPRFWFSLTPEQRQNNYAQLVIEVGDKFDTPPLAERLRLAIAALWIMGAPFSFMAFLGITSLVGVIVSHVIVLFDFIEENRVRGEPLQDSLLDAGIVRLRPVMITILATMFALVPLAIHGGLLWQPLCFAQIGGLALATFIELLLVKVFYVIFVLDLKIVKWDAKPGAAVRAAALRQRPDLQKARLNIQYADYSVALKRAEYIPDVSLVYKYIAPVTSDVLPQNISYVGIEFSWNVFDWGKKEHDLAQLERARSQSENSAEDLASQVVLDVNSSFRKLEDSRNYLKVAELNRDAARAQLRITMDAFRQQTALLKDLLSAQASLAQANDQYRQGVLGFWEARANFEKSVGSGD